MKAFVKPEIEKLAKFVMTRDLSREEFGRLFRAELDAMRTSTFSARAFTDAMKRLNGADFEITEVQAQAVFLAVTKQTKLSGERDRDQ